MGQNRVLRRVGNIRVDCRGVRDYGGHYSRFVGVGQQKRWRVKKLSCVVALVAAMSASAQPVLAVGELSCAQVYEEMKALAWTDYMTCLAQGFGVGGYYSFGCVATYSAAVGAASAYYAACLAIPNPAIGEPQH